MTSPRSFPRPGRTSARLLALLAVPLAVAAFAAAPAAAQQRASAPNPAAVTATSTGVTAAVEAFQQGESVYVSPDASNLISTAQADQLSAQVRDISYPFYVAVLPKSDAVGGSSSATLDAIHSGLNKAGTYVLYIGDGTSNAFKAGDTSTSVSTEATVAYRDYKDQGAYAVISNFITAAAPVVTGGGGSSGTGDGSGTITDPGAGDGNGLADSTSSSGGGAVLAVLAVGALAVGGGGFLAYRRG
jgi:hypothetical protein